MIFGNRNTAGLAQRLPAVETAAEIGFNIASAIISLGTTLGPVGGATLGLRVTGTARTTLLNTAKSPALQKWVRYLYREGAQVGDGGTAAAIRFERATGKLFSDAGHSIKGREAIQGLQSLLRSGKLGPEDVNIARQLINDLKSALK